MRKTTSQRRKEENEQYKTYDLVFKVLNPRKGSIKKRLQIIKQVDYGRQWNNGSISFHASNGFSICSSQVPEIDNPNELRFFVRGNHGHHDRKILTIPSESWFNRFKCALKEYSTTRYKNIRFLGSGAYDIRIRYPTSNKIGSVKERFLVPPNQTKKRTKKNGS